jgi:hypothetical protein
MLTGAIIGGASYGVAFLITAAIGSRISSTACLVEMASFVFIGAAIGWLVCHL